MPILFHTPTNWIGSDLRGQERLMFDDIKKDIIGLVRSSANSTKQYIFSIVKKFNKTDILGMDESIPLLKQVVKFLRHQLIEITNPEVYLRIVQLLDALVRKSGIRAHVLIGRKRFLQTLSLTARKMRDHSRGYSGMQNLQQNRLKIQYQEASDYTFDCIQAWHEAFYELRQIFPYYNDTYLKLKNKYHIPFPRAENDPSRIPIILEQCDDHILDERGPDDFLMSESIDQYAQNDLQDGNASEVHVNYSIYHADDSSFRHSVSFNVFDSPQPNQHSATYLEDSEVEAPVVGIEDDETGGSIVEMQKYIVQQRKRQAAIAAQAAKDSVNTNNSSANTSASASSNASVDSGNNAPVQTTATTYSSKSSKASRAPFTSPQMIVPPGQQRSITTTTTTYTTTTVSGKNSGNGHGVDMSESTIENRPIIENGRIGYDSRIIQAKPNQQTLVKATLSNNIKRVQSMTPSGHHIEIDNPQESTVSLHNISLKDSSNSSQNLNNETDGETSSRDGDNSERTNARYGKNQAQAAFTQVQLRKTPSKKVSNQEKNRAFTIDGTGDYSEDDAIGSGAVNYDELNTSSNSVSERIRQLNANASDKGLKSRSSSEKDGNFEIKFFGNQRVVIAKGPAM